MLLLINIRNYFLPNLYRILISEYDNICCNNLCSCNLGNIGSRGYFILYFDKTKSLEFEFVYIIFILLPFFYINKGINTQDLSILTTVIDSNGCYSHSEAKLVWR